MKQFAEKDIIGALVVDSEGYICGNVETIELLPENVFIVIGREDGKDKIMSWSSVKELCVSEKSKCIILSEPIEAEARGIEPLEKPPYCGTDQVKNKLVVDPAVGIIGFAVKVVFSLTEPPKLKVMKADARYEEVPDVDKLIESLVPSKYPKSLDLFTRVLKDLKFSGKFTVDDIKEKYLVPWAELNRINVPKKILADEKATVGINWGRIDKIGDVILLKAPFTTARGGASALRTL